MESDRRDTFKMVLGMASPNRWHLSWNMKNEKDLAGGGGSGRKVRRQGEQEQEEEQSPWVLSQA